METKPAAPWTRVGRRTRWALLGAIGIAAIVVVVVAVGGGGGGSGGGAGVPDGVYQEKITAGVAALKHERLDLISGSGLTAVAGMLGTV